MTTAAAIAGRLTALLAHTDGGIPQVITDSGALRRAAEAARTAGRRVGEAVDTIASTWAGLPSGLEAPGVIEPLYSAMAAPQRQGHELRSTTGSVAGVLEDYADEVDAAVKDFAALGDRAAALLARAQQEAGSADPLNLGFAVSPSTAAASPALVRDEQELLSDLAARTTRWDDAQRAVAQRLGRIRDAIDPSLLIGATTARTAGLTGSRDELNAGGTVFSLRTAAVDVTIPLNGMMLGWAWLFGTGGRNVVLDGDSGFAHTVRDDWTAFAGLPGGVHTMDVARAAARRQLAARARAGDLGLGEPLDVEGRSLAGASTAIPTFLEDAATVGANYTTGVVDLGTDESFLGSYGLQMTPIAAAGAHSVVVRVTVTNATTLASGTRIPGLEPTDDAFGRWKDSVVATGPASEQTQTITWTEVITYPGGRDR